MAGLERFALDGKVALVIGGSSGIGRGLALGLQAAGARLAIAGTTPAKVEAVTAELRAADPEATGALADVTDLSRLQGLIAGVIEQHGRLDVLVNAQGTLALKPAEDFDEADYERIMGTNLKSVFFACTEAARHMLARGSGAIVNIGSIASYVGLPNSALYTMSKRGVLGLTEVLAAEWAERGVRVNAIAPGFFMTPLNRDRMSDERKAKVVARTPMRRFGEIDELVGAAVYLASPAAGFVTGEILRVDGGFLATGI